MSFLHPVETLLILQYNIICAIYRQSFIFSPRVGIPPATIQRRAVPHLLQPAETLPPPLVNKLDIRGQKLILRVLEI